MTGIALALSAAVFFYLLAGWKQFQVILLTGSAYKDGFAEEFMRGRVSYLVTGFFVVFWLPLLTVTTLWHLLTLRREPRG